MKRIGAFLLNEDIDSLNVSHDSVSGTLSVITELFPLSLITELFLFCSNMYEFASVSAITGVSSGITGVLSDRGCY